MTPARIKFLIALGSAIRNGAVKTIKQAVAFAEQQFGKIDKSFVDDIVKVFKKEGKTKKGDVVPIKKKEGIVAADAAKEIVKKRTEDIAKGDVTGEVGGSMDDLESSIKELKKHTDELKKTTEGADDPFDIVTDFQKFQQRISKGGDMYKTGNIRTALRTFLKTEMDAGRLKVGKSDKFNIENYSPVAGESDPINIFRRFYGEEALEAVDDIGDVFQKGESYKHYEQLLRENVDLKFLTIKKRGAGQYDESVVAGEKLRKQAEAEAKHKKMLEDFEPDREPNAYGGIAGQLHLNRTGFKIGGIKKGIDLVAKYGPEFKKFADMLFIKASNMIRQGKGMWKGLDQKQMMQQHDNLTKKVNTFQKEGTLEGMDQYFGIDAVKAFEEARAKVKPGFIKKGDPITSENFGASQFAPSNERIKIKQKYPGITDDLVDQILIDDNPQRKAEILAAIDQYFELGKRGKSMEEAFEIVKQGLKHRTKQATGGLINILKL